MPANLSYVIQEHVNGHWKKLSLPQPDMNQFRTQDEAQNVIDELRHDPVYAMGKFRVDGAMRQPNRLSEFSVRLGILKKQFEELRQEIRSDDHACMVMVSDDRSLNSRLMDARSAFADAEIALLDAVVKTR